MVTDPLAAECQAAEGQTPFERLRERTGVLVVYDEHAVRITVRLGLEQNGFDVWLASCAQEAIQLYRHHRDSIDLVLLDVRMPGIDGPQTLELLRALNPGPVS
jgi:CheY-like chemotaxis protein